MMKKLYILLAMAAMILPQHSWAQDYNDDDDDMFEEQAPSKRSSATKCPIANTTFKGVTIDMETGQPVSGIKVQAMGHPRFSAMSNEKGEFAIKVPAFVRVLYVNAPQYLSQQVALPADTAMTVQIRIMSDKFRPMYSDQTVITARKGSDVNPNAAFSADEVIAASLNGDIRAVTRNGMPGAGATMLIRGIGSLNADAQPLIVIDGIEQDMQRSRTALHSGQFLNMLANLSVDDIERVEVLKNGTAIYGARGANGVILITTKRGHSMATRIDANIKVGLTTIPDLPKMMNASQYRTYAMDMIGTMNGANVLGNYKFLNDDPKGYYYNMYHNDTDWTDYTYRNALTQQYSVNVQGGDNIGMYNLSVGYSDAQATAKENGMSRINVRFNSDIDILWNLNTKFDISISRTQSDVFDDGVPADFSASTITSPTFLSMIKSPLLSPYQYNAVIGGFSSLLSEEDDIFNQIGKGYSLANPVAILQNGKDENKNYAENTIFNVKIEPTLSLGKGFKVTETLSYSLNRLSQRYFRPYTGVPAFEIAELGTVTSKVGSLFSKQTSILSNTRLAYENSFGAHSINAFAGFRYSYSSYSDNNLATEYDGVTNDKNPALSATNGYQRSDGTEDTWKNLQMYVSADYNYAQKYFLSATLLGEANSRFGKNVAGLGLMGVKWVVFPSIQAGWVMTNEEWFPKVSAINYLRLNVGYDISGNDNIPNYASRTLLSSVVYNYNAVGLKLSNIGNDEIQCETTRKFNAGMQAHLLDNRLSLAFDYYLHKTSNLLTLKTFDNPVCGINRYWTNGGKLQNEGFEVSVACKPVVTRDWHVELGTTIGHYDNKITELPDGNFTSSIYGTDNILTAVGSPVGLFYGYKTNGVFSTQDDADKAGLYIKDAAGNTSAFQAGDVRFVDLYDDPENKGLIDKNDMTVIGNPNPDFYGSFFINTNWKNLTLFIGFNYSVGNDIYNYQRSVLNSGSNFYNQQVQTLSRWRYEGQVTDMPKATYGDPMGNNRMSDRWIEDGSYLRLKTVRLSYCVPVPASWSWLQGLTVWGEASNLLTFTKYKGSDPEMSAAGGIPYQGIDTGCLPQSRTFTFGLKVNL